MTTTGFSLLLLDACCTIHNCILISEFILSLVIYYITALSRNKEDSPEFSLSEGGDEARTEQALQEAFDQATGQQNQQADDHAGLSLLQDSVLGMQPNGKSLSPPPPLLSPHTIIILCYCTNFLTAHYRKYTTTFISYSFSAFRHGLSCCWPPGPWSGGVPFN